MVQELVVYLILIGAVVYTIVSIGKLFRKENSRKGDYYCSGCTSNACYKQKR